MIRALTKCIPASIKARIRKHLAAPPARLEWIPGPSIERQMVWFRYGGRTLEVEADYTTPLYETVAELVDFDSYQLQRLPWPAGSSVTVLDIGANVGVSALMFASHPGTRVICFEPLPANCARLRGNAARNAFPSIQVVEAAITRADGTARFQPHPTISVAGRLAAGSSPEASIPVATLSLASALEMCAGDIFLIKMDCEGGEYDIMEQFTAEMAARVRNLTFEVHDIDAGRNLGTIQRRMELLGYRVMYRPDFHGRPGLHHLLGTRDRP